MAKEPPGPDVFSRWKEGDEEAKREVWEWISDYTPGKIYKTSLRADVFAFNFEPDVIEEIVLRALDHLMEYIENRLHNERDFQLVHPFALLGFWKLRITDGIRKEIRRRNPRQKPTPRKATSSKNTKVIGELLIMCHELRNDPLAYKAFRDRHLVARPALQTLFDAWRGTAQESSVKGIIEGLMDTLNWPQNRLYVYNRRLLAQWKQFSKS